MYFTVPMKYHHKTRLGNWYEEWELEETKMKDYLNKKEVNNLDCEKTEKKLLHSLQKVSLTYSKDGFLRFGDHITLVNKKTSGLLACDIWDRIPGNDESYATTTSTLIGPCARSVFALKRYENDLYQDNLIHYGQKIRIVVNPRLVKKELYLQSMPISSQNCAKFSRKQEVSVTPKNNFNSVWIMEYADPKVRFEFNGQPVRVNEEVLLRHSFTAQWLASDDISYRNDMGNEFEVFGHSFQWHNKTQNLIAEKTGRTTIDVPMRNQCEQNLWAIKAARTPEEEFDENLLDKTVSAEDLIVKIRNILIKRGNFGIRGLGKIFFGLDELKKKSLDFDDFKWGLRNYGLFLGDDDLKVLRNELTQNGNINYKDFMKILRGKSVKMAHQELIKKAYSKLESLSNKNVTLEVIAKNFDAGSHPDVTMNKKTDGELFREFMINWNTENKDGLVTFEEFSEYFEDLYCTYERDENFELMMNTSWNLKKI